jgi:hypothetical protein
MSVLLSVVAPPIRMSGCCFRDHFTLVIHLNEVSPLRAARFNGHGQVVVP